LFLEIVLSMMCPLLVIKSPPVSVKAMLWVLSKCWYPPPNFGVVGYG